MMQVPPPSTVGWRGGSAGCVLRVAGGRMGRCYLDVASVRLREAVARDGEEGHQEEGEVEGRTGEATHQVYGRSQHRDGSHENVQPQSDPECWRRWEAFDHSRGGLNRLSADSGPGQVIFALEYGTDARLGRKEARLAAKASEGSESLLTLAPQGVARTSPWSGQMAGLAGLVPAARPRHACDRHPSPHLHTCEDWPMPTSGLSSPCGCGRIVAADALDAARMRTGSL